MYDVVPRGEDDDPRQVDETWGRYERDLPAMLTGLRSSGAFGLVDTWQWMHVLVPLVSGLYVRSESFAHGKQVSHVEDGDLVPADPLSNLNLSRLPEQTRLLAPLMAARWEMHVFPDAELITSDRGFTLAQNEDEDVPSGICVPIDVHRALVILRRSNGTVSRAAGGRWVTSVSPVLRSAADAKQLNSSIARSAEEFIAGPSRAVIETNAAELAKPFKPAVQSLHLMWGTDDRLALNQTEWWSVRSAVTYPPDDSVRVQYGPFLPMPGWSAPPNEWIPTAFATPGRSPKLTGLAKTGGILTLNLDLAYKVREYARDLRSSGR